MSPSSEDPSSEELPSEVSAPGAKAVAVAALAAAADVLRRAAHDDADATADVHDQLAAENAVAAGIAVLASEPAPVPAPEPSGRPILARDLLATVQLVHGALTSV